jgi:exodeoxyribonuclease-3
VRLQLLLDWLAANPIDLLCLQELKLGDGKFPLKELGEAGHQ